jgi:hypothetical protein
MSSGRDCPAFAHREFKRNPSEGEAVAKWESHTGGVPKRVVTRSKSRLGAPDCTEGGSVRSCVAGAAAAIVWALQEPLDQKLLRCDYSDVGSSAKP